MADLISLTIKIDSDLKVMQKMIKSTIYTLLALSILLLSACFDDIKNPVGPNRSFAVVTINLSTSDDSSIAGAVVKLTYNTDSKITYTHTATAEDNVIMFDRVEYGTYTLVITLKDFSEFSILNFDVQAPTVPRSVTLSPQEYAEVTIELKTANNSNTIGAITRLVNNNGNSSQIYNHTVSDTTAYIAFFQSVAIGTYTFTVTLNTYKVYEDSFFIINEDVMSKSIHLDILSQVTIKLNPNFGSSYEANVTITNNNDKEQRFGIIATENIIVFDEVLWGRYTLEVEHLDFHPLKIDNFLIHTSAVSDTVNLAKIGPAGGFVFYDKGYDDDVWRYLEAAPADSDFLAQWGTYGRNVSGTQEGIGMGMRNTELVLAANIQMSETGMAAQTTMTMNIAGYTGWHLPSKDELNLMHEILHKNGFGGFQNSRYWSSTQYGSFLAWGIMFQSGIHTTVNKNTFARIRVVRAY